MAKGRERLYQIRQIDAWRNDEGTGWYWNDSFPIREFYSRKYADLAKMLREWAEECVMPMAHCHFTVVDDYTAEMTDGNGCPIYAIVCCASF